jgi:hypothetical protein
MVKSKGSIKRAYKYIEDMLAPWIAQNKTNDRPNVLKCIQFKIITLFIQYLYFYFISYLF